MKFFEGSDFFFSETYFGSLTKELGRAWGRVLTEAGQGALSGLLLMLVSRGKIWKYWKSIFTFSCSHAENFNHQRTPKFKISGVILVLSSDDVRASWWKVLFTSIQLNCNLQLDPIRSSGGRCHRERTSGTRAVTVDYLAVQWWEEEKSTRAPRGKKTFWTLSKPLHWL